MAKRVTVIRYNAQGGSVRLRGTSRGKLARQAREQGFALARPPGEAERLAAESAAKHAETAARLDREREERHARGKARDKEKAEVAQLLMSISL